MMPGPPPVIVAMPFFAMSPPTCRAFAYIGSSGVVLAEPNTVTAGPSSASAPNPSTNSAWMRSTRQGSVCSQAVSVSGCSRWLTVVSRGIIWPRMITGPRR